MEHHTLDNWKKDFRHDGLLYFTQRIEEMLFDYTDHIFKAPVLNTYLLAEEFLINAEFVKNNIVKQGSLKEIIDEFRSSFESDIVLEKHFDEQEKNKILRMVNNPQLEEQIKIMKYVLFLLKDYNMWCKAFLEEIVPNEKEKKKIERGIRCYIPSLISSGYSHDFVREYNNEVFNKREVKSLKSLGDFLERFNYEQKFFDVYIAIKLDSPKFQELLMSRMEIDFGTFDDPFFSEYTKIGYRIVKLTTTAFDQYSAARSIYYELNRYFKYFCFLTELTENWCINIAKVVDSSDKNYYVNLRPVGVNHSKTKARKELGEFSDFIICGMQKCSTHTKTQIDRALNAHNTAIKDLDLNNRFLNLWSALEILFISDHNTSKILEVKNKIMPILQKDYIPSLFNSIQVELYQLMDRSTIENYESLFENNEKHFWYIYFITLKQYATQRGELYACLKDYPLLRNRISFINEIFSNKKILRKTMQSFENRISWHISRLYRTRNTIIHSGIEPTNIYALVEHLHGYSDQSLFEIIVLLTRMGQLGSISNCLFDVQYRFAKMMDFLRNDGEFSKDDINYLFNTISPK